MKGQLIAIVAAVVLVGTAFADPIHDATKAGDLAGVQAELDKGVDVNKKDKAEMTPLHPAAANGHKEIAELLIAAGADVNAKDRWGMTPLHWAARKGHKEVAELLLTKGADVNAKANDGTTPLDWAIQKSRIETADILRKHGGKTAEELEFFFHAIGDGDLEAVNKAISDGFDFNNAIYEGHTPLHMAVDCAFHEIGFLGKSVGMCLHNKIWWKQEFFVVNSQTPKDWPSVISEPGSVKP